LSEGRRPDRVQAFAQHEVDVSNEGSVLATWQLDDFRAGDLLANEVSLLDTFCSVIRPVHDERGNCNRSKQRADVCLLCICSMSRAAPGEADRRAYLAQARTRSGSELMSGET
jgi:hypothetical protein